MSPSQLLLNVRVQGKEIAKICADKPENSFDESLFKLIAHFAWAVQLQLNYTRIKFSSV